jgi:septum formation protein
MDFYLASQSPRRIQFLQELGYRFRVLPADLPEQPQPSQTVASFSQQMAIEKATAVFHKTGLCSLGADTDVSLDGRILGKPQSRAEALSTLLALSNRRHQVVSAVALVSKHGVWSRVVSTEVEMACISPEAAARYCDTPEPYDKAGSYGIQGHAARWIKAIYGSYSGVVGLPLVETQQLLAEAGIHPQLES